MHVAPLPDRPAAIDCAASFLQRTGITVLDRDWVSPFGHGQLDIAALHNHVFIAAVVRCGRPGSVRSRRAQVSARAARRVRRVARQWLEAHGTRAEEIRIDLVTLLAEGTGGYTLQHAQGVA